MWDRPIVGSRSPDSPPADGPPAGGIKVTVDRPEPPVEWSYSFIYRIIAAAVAVTSAAIVVTIVAWLNEWQLTPAILLTYGCLVAIIVAIGEYLRSGIYERKVEETDRRADREAVEELLRSMEIERNLGYPLAQFAGISPPVSSYYLAAKRGFDVALGSIFLVVTAPLICLIAIAIKLETPGPILVGYLRLTTGGRLFRMYRFRTMHLRYGNMTWEETLEARRWVSLEHPALTSIGRFLRRTPPAEGSIAICGGLLQSLHWPLQEPKTGAASRNNSSLRRPLA